MTPRSGISLHLVAILAALLSLVPVVTFFSCGDNESGDAAVSGDSGAPGNKPGNVPPIALLKVAGGFSRPLFVTHAGDGTNRLFVVEQGGAVKIIRNGGVLPVPFLDISPRLVSSGEQGLLSVVFPPGPSAGNYFYVNYTRAPGGDTVISRFAVGANADRADPESEQQLLTIEQPFMNHNGGQMAFGPDGYLYIGTGDGGSAGDPRGNAQNPDSLLGKLLRINVEPNLAQYRVPADNPFAATAGYRPEIWARGLRNPWRFSFDRQTGDLYIADVGQDALEEVNLQRAGGPGGENYGWNIMEGTRCYRAASCGQTGLTLPVFAYNTRGQGNCSVTGGYVYRGREFPALKGVYVYGDFCSGRIWGLRQAGEWINTPVLESGLTISSFGEDEAGNLYVADHANGDIYKIVPR